MAGRGRDRVRFRIWKTSGAVGFREWGARKAVLGTVAELLFDTVVSRRSLAGSPRQTSALSLRTWEREEGEEIGFHNDGLVDLLTETATNLACAE